MIMSAGTIWLAVVAAGVASASGCGRKSTVDADAFPATVGPPGRLAGVAAYAPSTELDALGLTVDRSDGFGELAFGADQVRAVARVPGTAVRFVEDPFGRVYRMKVLAMPCDQTRAALTRRWGAPAITGDDASPRGPGGPPTWRGQPGAWSAWLSPHLRGSSLCDLDFHPLTPLDAWLHPDGSPPDVPAWVTATTTIDDVRKHATWPAHGWSSASTASVELPAPRFPLFTLQFTSAPERFTGVIYQWLGDGRDGFARNAVAMRAALTARYGPPTDITGDVDGAQRWIGPDVTWVIDLGIDLRISPRVTVAAFLGDGPTIPWMGTPSAPWALLGAAAADLDDFFPGAVRDAHGDVTVPALEWSENLSNGQEIDLGYDDSGHVAQVELSMRIGSPTWVEAILAHLASKWGPPKPGRDAAAALVYRAAGPRIVLGRFENTLTLTISK